MNSQIWKLFHYSRHQTRGCIYITHILSYYHAVKNHSELAINQQNSSQGFESPNALQWMTTVVLTVIFLKFKTVSKIFRSVKIFKF